MPDDLPRPIPSNRALPETKSDAPSASAHYMREAIAAIDAEFGEGYARANPALIASMIQASAIESAVNTGREAHGQAMALAPQITREVCETMLKLKPRLFG
jgi:hypothetical protein